MSKFQVQDKYFKQAKKEGYRARSAFKLQSIDERFNLLKFGMNVLDLGSAPGSFLQYISEKVGKKGGVIGIDLQDIESLKLSNLRVYKGNIFDDSLYKKIVQENALSRFDLITSDLAPKTTGIPFVDGNASLDLNLQVLEVAHHYLKKGSGLVMKVLSGFNEGDLIGKAKKQFKIVKKFRPKAIRRCSCESYIVCLEKKY